MKYCPEYTDARIIANGLLLSFDVKAILHEEFIFSILKVLKPADKICQSKQASIIDGYSVIHTLINTLLCMRLLK